MKGSHGQARTPPTKLSQHNRLRFIKDHLDEHLIAKRRALYEYAALQLCKTYRVIVWEDLDLKNLSEKKSKK
ncbi:MAG: hypothetical protein ACHQ7N_18120 [Candidatus Methylomirabilales bacterium]